MRMLMTYGRRAGVASLLTLTLAGCYVPGGGWTMRTGLDFRTKWKPGAFFEMVDTRWDEYNRVACQNSQCSTASRSQARGTNGGAAGTDGGTGAGGMSGHGGCLFGFPIHGTITPVPSNGPTLAPGYAPDPNRPLSPPDPAGGANSVPLNSVPPNPVSPSPIPFGTIPQYAPTPFPVPPQPMPNGAPQEAPAGDELPDGPRNEPSPAPGVTATGQYPYPGPSSAPANYGAWQSGGSGPALMLPAPDPIVPAYGDLGGGSSEATPALSTTPNAGLELSGYEQLPPSGGGASFTAGSKVNSGRGALRPTGRKRVSGEPLNHTGANRHFSRPRL